MSFAMHATPPSRPPEHARQSVVIARRAKLFYKACIGFAATGSLFYVIAIIHPEEERRFWIIILTSLYILCSLIPLALAKKHRLTLAVNASIAINTLILTVGMWLAHRTGVTIWFYILAFSISNFHVRARYILLAYVFILLNTLIICSLVPVTGGLLQLASFLVTLTMMSTLSYFSAGVTTQNIEDILKTNDMLNHTNVELTKARQQADAANQAKSMFLATMSHELRTPLNAIIGYAEMMRETIEDDDHVDPEEATHDLSQIEHAGKHLLALVSGVLDLTRIESEPMHLEFETFSLSDLLKSTCNMVEPMARSKGLRLLLDVQLPEEHDELNQDRTRLEQVVLNLLTNAVKFTDQGSISLLASLHHTRHVRIEVRDTGIGIAPEDHDKVFELFTQIDNSYTRAADGAGIGLFLCRKIARHLGGDLTVESELGAGASFFFEIPISAHEEDV